MVVVRDRVDRTRLETGLLLSVEGGTERSSKAAYGRSIEQHPVPDVGQYFAFKKRVNENLRGRFHPDFKQTG